MVQDEKELKEPNLSLVFFLVPLEHALNPLRLCEITDKNKS